MLRLQGENIHIRADLVNSKNQSGRVQPMKDQKMSDLTRLLQEWDKKIGSDLRRYKLPHEFKFGYRVWPNAS
eukprot:3939894-Rhodomonas_salina.1